MRRPPPKGKPSLKPTVDLLRETERLANGMNKWLPGNLALPIIAAILHVASRDVAYLLDNGAPTAAMKHVVLVVEAIKSVRDSLQELGPRSTEVLTAAGAGTYTDIIRLKEFLEIERKDVKVKKDVAEAKPKVKMPTSDFIRMLLRAQKKRLITPKSQKAKGKCNVWSPLHHKTSACRDWKASDSDRRRLF